MCQLDDIKKEREGGRVVLPTSEAKPATMTSHSDRPASPLGIRTFSCAESDESSSQREGGSEESDEVPQEAKVLAIPRVSIHQRAVRSPDYFRTQYLNNIGIWAQDRARALSGQHVRDVEDVDIGGDNVSSYSPRRHRMEGRRQPVSAATSPSASRERPSRRAQSETPPRRPLGLPPSFLHSPPSAAGSPLPSPAGSAAAQTARSGGTASPRDSTELPEAFQVDAAVPGKCSESDSGTDRASDTSDASRVLAAAVQHDATAEAAEALPLPLAAAAGSVATAASAAPPCPVCQGTDLSCQKHPMEERTSLASPAVAAPMAAAAASEANDDGSSDAVPADVATTMAMAETAAPTAAGAAVAADRVTPPAARPPRRDVRRHYLSNLGITAGSQPPHAHGDGFGGGGGGAGGAPLLVRRPSFSERNPPVAERLKDRQEQEISFDDLVKVLGNLVGGGKGLLWGQRPKDAAGGPAGDGTAGVGGNNGSGGESEGARANRHVRFSDVVSAAYVPVHTEYSNRVRRSYWTSAGEIREMVYRNMLEYDAEGYDWHNVAEEEDMYYCEDTGEWIHPVFFAAEEEDARQAAAVAGEMAEATPESVTACEATSGGAAGVGNGGSGGGSSGGEGAEDRFEMVNDGRKGLAVLRRSDGIVA
ncbi:unnamed protein product [Phaeothamnion confervicola]